MTDLNPDKQNVVRVHFSRPTVTNKEVGGGAAMGHHVYGSVSQPPGRGPVPGPGINYTGPREVLLEDVVLVF